MGELPRLMFDRCPEEMENAALAAYPDPYLLVNIGICPDPCSGCPSWGPDCAAIWTLDGRELSEAERDAACQQAERERLRGATRGSQKP